MMSNNFQLIFSWYLFKWQAYTAKVLCFKQNDSLYFTSSIKCSKKRNVFKNESQRKRE